MTMYSTLRTIAAIAAITAISLTSPAVVRGGKLSVGTKVIYPGGADQPPREKDTGVSLNADVKSAAILNNETDFPNGIISNNALEKLDKAGAYELMLQSLENRSDDVALAYKAIALEATDEYEEGENIALRLVKKGSLPHELKKRLIKKFDLEDFIDSEM